MQTEINNIEDIKVFRKLRSFKKCVEHNYFLRVYYKNNSPFKFAR